MAEESAEQLVHPASHPIYPNHFDELIFKNKDLSRSNGPRNVSIMQESFYGEERLRK